MTSPAPRPPRLAEWLLVRRLRRDEKPLVLGDLEEQFHERALRESTARAALWYWREALWLWWGFWWWQPHAERSWKQVMAMDDVRYALRRLRRRPLAAAVSVVTLACAIGAAAATWSLVSAALLNPLRVPAPDRLVQVGFRYREPGRRGPVTQSGYTYPTYLALRAAIPMPLAAWGTIGSATPLVIEGAGDPIRPRGVVFADHSFLDILGLQPTIGRFFTDAEDRRGAALVGVLSERFWRLELDSDPGVIGRVIRVRDQPVQIVGVGPRGFRGLEVYGAPSLFMPLHAIDRIQPYEGLYGDRPPLHWVDLVARLPEGVSAETMEARLNALQLDLTRDRIVVLTDVQTAALPETARADVRQFSRLLGATVALLLAIGSLTVGMLLLLRTDARRGELAMCLALGASRARLAAGVALEGLVLTAAGALLALPISTMLFAGIQLFELPGGIRVDRLELSLDGRVLAGAVAAAAVSVLLVASVASLFGIRGGFGDLLRAYTGGTPRRGRRRSRSVLVVVQVAMTLVLVTGMGLFARSVLKALSLNPGVDTSRLVTTSLNLEQFGYDPARAASFGEELDVRLRRRPEIAAIGWRYSSRGGNVVVEGARLDPPVSVVYAAIDLDYLETLGLRISAGRSFTAEDRPGAPAVALVSEALARRIAGTASPLGRRIAEAFEGGPPAEIVGVVPSIRSVASLEPMVMYRPLAQQPIRSVPPGRGVTVGRRLAFRATDDAGAAIAAVSRTVRAMDPAIRLDPMMSEDAYALDRMAPQRFGMTVMGAFGIIALILSALGTYVLAESMATERRREMGIRAALGAGGRQLRTLVLSETYRLVCAGLLLGLALAWLGAGTIRAFLFQIEPLDPVVVGGAAAIIAGLATLVSLRPALTASRLNLARVLRDD
jgi:predicted permease